MANLNFDLSCKLLIKHSFQNVSFSDSKFSGGSFFGFTRPHVTTKRIWNQTVRNRHESRKITSQRKRNPKTVPGWSFFTNL